MAQPAWMLPTQFLHAINSNDPTQGHRLLTSGVDCDHTYRHGNISVPALSLAVERGSIDVVELLLSWRCSVAQTDSCGDTALHRAVYLGRADIAGLLLRHRASVNAPNVQGQTPLHLAAIRGKTDVLDVVLDAGADTERLDGRQMTALLLSCQQGHSAAALKLLRRGASPLPTALSGDSALHLLCRAETACACVESARQLAAELVAGSGLLERRNADDYSPLTLAVAAGKLPLIDELLQAGADLTADHSATRAQLLKLTAGAGQLQLVRQLLVHGMVHVQTAAGAVETACRGQHWSVTSLLLAVGAPVKMSRSEMVAAPPPLGQQLLRRGRNPLQLAQLCRTSVLALRPGSRPVRDLLSATLPPSITRYILLQDM